MVSDESGRPQALELASTLRVHLLPEIEESVSGIVLEFRGEKLILHPGQGSGFQPWELKFNSRYPGRGSDPLYRAIGTGVSLLVDATAGWCTDALHIARYGVSVIAIERSPAVAAIVRHALQQLEDPLLAARIKFMQGESTEMISGLSVNPDVVYLDPMYPPSRKSAATKKELVLLRSLVGEQGGDIVDQEILLEAAMNHATRRVVVKRPHHADPIAPGKVGETRGKMVRFDIYPAYAGSRLNE